ncbi:MAG: DUF58 domain-containing protein [Casimicrobiaceae bacterium]
MTHSRSLARDGLLNAATHVTAKDLIALQRHAGSIDLARAPAARARLTGDHASRFRGRGVDYQESRGYQIGDDIRSMDWRVTARTGKPHTKLYHEERERPIVLFIDLNPGMFFGTRGALKSVVAAQAGALIGWAAAAHGDRVGGMLFNGSHRELQPRGGRHGVLRLIRQLVELTDPLRTIAPSPLGSTMNVMLARLRRVSRPGSLIFLVSDFYGIDEETGKHLLRLRQHSDVAAIHIVDPVELSVPQPGSYGITDGSRVDILDLRSNKARRAYQEYFQRHHETVAALMRSRAISLLRVSTEDDVAARLRSHFATTIIAPVAEPARAAA